MLERRLEHITGAIQRIMSKKFGNPQVKLQALRGLEKLRNEVGKKHREHLKSHDNKVQSDAPLFNHFHLNSRFLEAFSGDCCY